MKTCRPDNWFEFICCSIQFRRWKLRIRPGSAENRPRSIRACWRVLRSSRVVSFSSWFSLNSMPKAPSALRAYSCSVRWKPQPTAFERPPALAQASGLI
ncbi:hypothetical protein D3C81_2085750 [compost metagenome]